MVQHTETQPLQRVAYIHVVWLQNTTESELLLGNTYDRVFLALCKDLNKQIEDGGKIGKIHYMLRISDYGEIFKIISCIRRNKEKKWFSCT